MKDEKRDLTRTVYDPRPSTESEEPEPKSAKPRAKRVSVAPRSVKGAGVKIAPKPEPKPAPKKKATKKSAGPRSRRPGRASGPDSRVALSKEREDEISIPPSSPSTDDLDEHDERFFAEGEAASQHGAVLEETLRVIAGRAHSDDTREVRAVVPPGMSRERRRKLTNYVKAAVAVSAVLCLAALIRVGITRVDPSAERSAAAAQIAAVGAPLVHAAVPVVPPPSTPPVAPIAAAVAPPEPVAAATPAVPEVPAKSARENKEDARRSLERGKAKDAAEAAARSVETDATDAEGWLILGAAQQDLGHGAEAHAAFLACTKQAKKGPVGECAAMLRWNGPK